MKRICALAAREMRGKGLILLGGLLLGFLPFLTPHLATVGTYSDAEARDVTANVLATFLATGMAIFLGYFAIGGDLAEGRLGFYFSRPFATGEIWAGKFLGNLSAIFLAAVLVVAPATIAGGGLQHVPRWKIPLSLSWLPLPDLSGEELLVGFAVALALIFSLSHVVGIAIRARSVWLLVDFLAISATVVFLDYSSRRLVFAWAIEAWHRGAIVLAGGMVVGLLAACYFSVSAGRTDLRRATRSISTAFLTVIVPCLLGFEVYSRWVVRVSPRDLVKHDLVGTSLVPATQRQWVVLSGNARRRWDYEPYFLWNPDSGDYLHIGDRGFHWPMSDAFSPDGTIAAWLRVALGAGSWEYRLQYADLSKRSPAAVSTAISFSGEPPNLVISPDNRTVAALGQRSIVLADIQTGSWKATFKLPPTRPGTEGLSPKAHFIDAKTLEVFRPVTTKENRRSVALDLFDLHVPDQTLTAERSLDVPEGFLFFSADPSAERILLRERVSHDLWLYEAKTAAVLHHFVSTPEAQIRWGDFLPDETIAIGEVGASSARLRIVSPDGKRLLRVIDLGTGRNLVFGGLSDPDHIFILIRPKESGPLTEGRLVVVDPRTGEVSFVARNLYPAAWRLRWLSADPARLPQPGSIASRLFYGEGDSLVEYQPSSGTFTTLIPGTGKK
jgi:hypothetical protein